MTERVLGPSGSTRRRRFLFWPLLAAAFTALFFVAGAQAVHDTGAFQLDGNALTSLQSSPTANDDWDRVCHQVNPVACPAPVTNTTGATAVSWTAEANPSSSIFTGGGSKDPSDVSSWAWKDAGGLPDKDNLQHGFAARYSLPSTGATTGTCPSGTAATCELLFFGSDRFDNSGDAQQGFWFFQNPITLGNTPNGGGSSFNGVHKLGDLLIISDFSNGGTTSFISVYRWNPAVSGNLELLSQSGNARCDLQGNHDAFCGIVNPGTTTMPWGFLDKSGTPNRGALNGEFYEGGINLSTLGLSGECFASVASETRSSTSTTATLKDFVLGGFGKCESGLATTPKDAAGADLPAGGLSIGTGSVSVKDSAALTISGAPTWTGTLKFFLCKVAAIGDTGSGCTNQVGAAAGITVTNTTTQPILSAAAAVTAAANGSTGAPGRYCWRSTFTSGTSGVPNAEDASATECFTVNPLQPTFSTTASGTVEIGNSIDDVAHLGNTANQPGSPVIDPTTAGSAAGGTITFKLYGPSATAVCTTAIATRVVNVGGNGDYNASQGDGQAGSSGSRTPTSAGTYYWVASYSGDSPNTLSAAGACGDGNESVVITPKQPTISTQVNHEENVTPGTVLSDTATLSGTATPSNGVGGTITFTVYRAADATTCTTLVGTFIVSVDHGNGDYSSGTTFAPITPGHYNWIASYTPDAGDANNLPVSGTCGDAHEGSVVIQLQPTMDTAQRFVPNDSATVTVASGAGALTGSVRFRLYDNATCDPIGTTLYDKAFNIVTDGTGTALSRTVSTDNLTAYTADKSFSWLVQYTSTNAGHTNVTSECNHEHSSITIVNGGTSNTP